MRPSMQIATAVAAALTAASGLAVAAPPTLAQAAAAPTTLYIAGSSAAKAGILKALQTDMCGGAANALTITSTGNTNFLAVSCTSVLPGAPAGFTTVYYRTEGGSVVGALPIVTGKAIATLDLTAAGITCGTATTCSAPVGGTSGQNGISDTFTGAVTKKTVQLGITDVEPGVLVGDNYPSAYQTSVYGKATTLQMQGLPFQSLFGQTFGIFVNTNSAAFSAAEKNNGATPGVLNISKAALTNILQGNSTNWNAVPDTSGNAVTSASQAISIVNREQGSGSRASTAIFFTNDGCQPGAISIKEGNSTGDFFSTGNVLAAASLVPGSITYASIDNFSTTNFPNLTLVSIDGITPSNLAAASGQYGFWYEATAVISPSLSGASLDLANSIIGVLQDIASEPHLVDVIAIPGNAANTAALPVSSTANGSPAIYVNSFFRGGSSCSSPTSAL